MAERLPFVYLARHGETAWSISGQHTGRTDLPLTQRGEENARKLGERLKGLTFAKVLTSPLQRALRTCELAGFGAAAEIDRDLLEWDYGEYEGKRTAEIHAERRVGSCFAMAAPAERRRPRSALGRIAWSIESGLPGGTCSFSPAGISCACSPRVGWSWSR